MESVSTFNIYKVEDDKYKFDYMNKTYDAMYDKINSESQTGNLKFIKISDGYYYFNLINDDLSSKISSSSYFFIAGETNKWRLVWRRVGGETLFYDKE